MAVPRNLYQHSLVSDLGFVNTLQETFMTFLKIEKQLHHFPVDSLSAGKTIRQAAGISMYKIRDICELHVCECMHVYKNDGRNSHF